MIMRLLILSISKRWGLPGARIIEQLQRRGFKATGPRRAVVEVAIRHPGRFTARDILAELRPRGVGRATVFRTLDLLVDLGVLNRIHSEDRCHAYTVCMEEHHHHLVCNQCGQIQEVTVPTIERDVNAVAREAGFRVQGHYLEVFGLCLDCQRNHGE